MVSPPAEAFRGLVLQSLAFGRKVLASQSFGPFYVQPYDSCFIPYHENELIDLDEISYIEVFHFPDDFFFFFFFFLVYSTNSILAFFSLVYSTNGICGWA